MKFVKTGLVLEGGAMRGLFTAGVIDVLMENNIKFDGAVGVSAGAAFGVNYKSHQIGRVLRYNLKFAGDPRFASWKSWRKSGNLYGTNFCYHIIPDELDKFDKETFVKDPMEFWCVATNAETGKPVYHKLTNAGYLDLEWIRASASIPFFAHPVAIRGNYYFDGGVSDSIPLTFFDKLNYGKKVIITTQPHDYRKKRDKLWPIEKTVLRKYPAILEKIKTRSQDYNQVMDQMEQEEKIGKCFTIRPPYPLEIGTMESDKKELTRVYQIGREEARKRLSDLINYLKEE